MLTSLTLTARQTSAYLARLGLDPAAAHPPDLRTLPRLQRAHMQAVPFENLDVFLRRPLSLERDALFAKVVTRRRGGYCFELNALYAALLRTLGFAVTPRLARVWLRDPAEPPTRNHLPPSSSSTAAPTSPTSASAASPRASPSPSTRTPPTTTGRAACA